MQNFRLVCDNLNLPNADGCRLIYKSFGFFIPFDSDVVHKGHSTKEFSMICTAIQRATIQYYFVRYEPYSPMHTDQVYEIFPKILDFICGKNGLCFMQDYTLTHENAEDIFLDMPKSDYAGQIILRTRSKDPLPALYELDEYTRRNHFDAFWNYGNRGFIVNSSSRQQFFKMTQSTNLNSSLVDSFFKIVSWFFTVKESEQGIVFAHIGEQQGDFCNSINKIII